MKRTRIRSAPFKARLPTAHNEKCFKCGAIIYPVIIQGKELRQCSYCRLIRVKCPEGETLAPKFTFANIAQFAGSSIKNDF